MLDNPKPEKVQYKQCGTREPLIRGDQIAEIAERIRRERREISNNLNTRFSAFSARVLSALRDGVFFFVVVHEPRNAVSKHQDVKVNKKPHLYVKKSHVRQHLSVIHGVQGFLALEFDDHRPSTNMSARNPQSSLTPR